MLLDGRTAIVTGGGRNIGQAIAHALLRQGAQVAVADLDDTRARTVADQLGAVRAGAALAVTCDVSDPASVQAMVTRVGAQLGGVDILVNNVAVTDRLDVLRLDADEWDRVLNVTLKSVFLCTKYAAQAMVTQGRGGTVINIGSTSGHRGRRNSTAYTAAKAGVLNLTRSLALQLGPHGIRVNSVSPNKVGSPVGQDTETNDRTVDNVRGRKGLPDDIADAVVFLASASADFVTGTDLLVDGGALLSGGP